MPHKNKTKPIMYKRLPPDGFIKVEQHMDKEIKLGTILEFQYGQKQKYGEVGGWKNDPIPQLLVIYDEFHNTSDSIIPHIEGINLNYLSDYYVQRLKAIQMKFPGIDGEDFYRILKRTAEFAVKKGYRRYLRKSIKNPKIIVYKEK